MQLTDEMRKKLDIRQSKIQHKIMIKAGNKNKLYAMLRQKYHTGILETETAEGQIVDVNIVQYVKMLEEEIRKDKIKSKR